MTSFRMVLRVLQPFLWACISFWMVCLVLLAVLPMHGELQLFNGAKGSWVDLFFIYATKMGEEHGYIVITLAALVLLDAKRAFWIPLTGFFVSLVSFLTKSAFRSPRPGHFMEADWFKDQVILVDGIVPLSGFTSFPSGHTMSAFALAAMTIYLFPRSGWLAAGLFFLAVLVGISRVYLVMHFLRDVLLGSVLGVLVGLLLAWAHQAFVLRKSADQASSSVSN